MFHKALQNRLFATACLIALPWTGVATAALAPGTVEKMRNKAPELLKIKILTVAKGAKKGEKQKVVYTANVLRVVRSAAGIKKDQTVTIHAYIKNPDFKGFPKPGPRFPTLLNKGWTGRAYLEPAGKGEDLEIAVYGHSFEAEAE